VKASNELEPVAVVAHALGMAQQNAQRKIQPPSGAQSTTLPLAPAR
jgi:hypothetical protein